MMQKKIIYFAIPFLFLSSFMFLRKNDIIYYHYNFSLKKIFNYKVFLTIIYLCAFIFITFKTLLSSSNLFNRDLDFLFLIINYFSFNLLLFLYIKYYQNNNFENLLTYNIVLISFFYFYKFFLIYFFSAHIAVWSISFTNFMGHLNMFVTNNELKQAFDFSSITLYLHFLSLFFKDVFIKYFFSFSYQAILLWTNILLFMVFFKKIIFKEKVAIITLFSGFLIVQSILLFRYEQDTYYLNSEFLLLFSLSVLFKYIKINISYFVGVSFLFIILNLSNLNHIKNIQNTNHESICSWYNLNQESSRGFYSYWTKRFPNKVFSQFCRD